MKRSLTRSLGGLLVFGVIVGLVMLIVLLQPYQSPVEYPPPEPTPTPALAVESPKPTCSPNYQGEVGIGFATPCILPPP